MFNKSQWLRNHGLWLKIGLIALFVVCLGGMNCIIFARDNMKEPNYPTHNTGLDDWNRPEAYVGQEFENWKSRKEAVSKELEIIFKRARAKAEGYSLVDYFQDFDQLMVLEDKYNFYLTNHDMLQPLLRLRDAKGMWSKANKKITPEQEKYIASIQQKIEQRDGMYSNKADFNARQVGYACLFWLIQKYLILMLFWCLVYIIRFEEHTKAIRRFQRHHSELGRFIDVEEPFEGKLSFYDEMLIAPWRFALRVILWPKYCWNYLRYESPAQMLRFNRLKAEFLRYKPLGYQLTPREEAILRTKARKPVKDFGQAIASLFKFPALVRRSVYLGYLSLVLGILLQPAIVLTASHSKKAENHFYGQVQIVLIEHQNDSGSQIRDGTGLPSQQHDQLGNDCSAWTAKDLVVPMGLSEKLGDLILIKPKEVFTDIVHVPISGLLAARCF